MCVHMCAGGQHELRRQGLTPPSSVGLLISSPSVLLSLGPAELCSELARSRELEMNPAAGATSCLLQSGERGFIL